MAIPVVASAVLSALWSAGKQILAIPIVHRGLDNFLDGLVPTWVDRLLWHGLAERLIGLPECPGEEKSVVVAEVAAVTQEKYDLVKERVIAGVPERDAVLEVVGPIAMPWMDETAPIGEP